MFAIHTFDILNQIFQKTLPKTIIIYDGVHYETLKPATPRDEQLTQSLATKIRNNEVVLKYEDFAVFEQSENAPGTWANVVKDSSRQKKMPEVMREAEERWEEQRRKRRGMTEKELKKKREI